MSFFGPDSMSWRLYREPLVLTGGFRALLLQIAHPSVADGVARYSNFKTDALGRGYRTFEAMATIYFGDQEQARQVAAHLGRVHTSIRGTGYIATDAELQCWVWATLIHTSYCVFEPAAGMLHLPEGWREQFYTESKLMATILGIPESAIPVDLPAFFAYFDAVLAQKDLLAATPTSRELAQAILNHKLVWKPLGRLLALGWLPDSICAGLGIDIRPHSRQRFERLLKWVIRLYGWLPIPYAPAYHQGMYRIDCAAGRRPTRMSRWYHWLGQRIKIPLGIAYKKSEG
jgi:uncharacterized protein (DUF2236 family)